MHGLKYELEYDGGNFLQFASSEEDWDIDLMLVNAETFNKMLQQARTTEIESATILVPSLDHLLALKLHALKHGQPRRYLKDLDDVINLIQYNHYDVRAAGFRQLCEKHADAETYERIIRLCS